MDQRPCRHSHLQFLSKLVTRNRVPKYEHMEHRQWELQFFSNSMPKHMTPLEKYLFSSLVFKYFQNKTSSLYTITVIIPTVSELSQICSICWFDTLHDRETTWKKLILSTTYDNKKKCLILSSSAGSFDKGCDSKFIKRHFTVSIARMALQPLHFNSLRSRTTHISPQNHTAVVCRPHNCQDQLHINSSPPRPLPPIHRTARKAKTVNN